MDQYKCSKIARQKCPDSKYCGEGTYTGTECECAKFNEKCLPTKQRNIISELRDENATLKKALELMAADNTKVLHDMEKVGIIKITKDSDTQSMVGYYIQHAQEQEKNQ